MPTDTLPADAVETIATKHMGWRKVPFATSFAWCSGAAGDYAANLLWNPFTDANADVQVLERAREVFDYDRRRMLGRSLEAAWLARFDARQRREDEPVKALQILLVQEYRVGDYARAVLSVLQQTEEPAALERDDD